MSWFMGKISSLHIRILGVIVALAVVLGAFQNCGVSSDFGQMKASNKPKGNGEGYGGKVTLFAHLGLKCDDSLPQDLLEKRAEDFYIVRQNCAVVSAIKIAAGQVDHLSHSRELALFDSKVFKEYIPTNSEQTPTTGTGVTMNRWLCRGSDTLVAYPREVIDTVVTDRQDTQASVKVVRYSAEGVVSAGAVEIQFLTVYQRAVSGAVTTETFTGQVPAGESFGLTLRSDAQPALNFSLKLGANTYTRSPQVSCYKF
jgi:hypothetical protein